MDAEHLIRAQSEAAAAACEGLVPLYRCCAVERLSDWLDTAATEFVKFSRARRLLAAPLAAWVTILREHQNAPPSSLGVGFSTGFSSDQIHAARINVQRLVRSVFPTSGRKSRPSPRADGIDPAGNGMFHERVTDDAGGAGLVLGGLVRDDGHFDDSAADDELLTTFFRFVAGAAADRVLRPLSVRERMCSLLTPAQERVLELLADGKGTLEIAALLGRSAHTVHEHVQGVYRALEVNSRFDVQNLWYARKPLSAATLAKVQRIVSTGPVRSGSGQSARALR